ncbi:hypothetical protein HanPSC8_Chr15g0663271 [Helianthus annuus]|nr:hypothetical protein HanPSC8_Chr15g0663271 [Helianthus annuus]
MKGHETKVCSHDSSTSPEKAHRSEMQYILLLARTSIVGGRFFSAFHTTSDTFLGTQLFQLNL